MIPAAGIYAKFRREPLNRPVYYSHFELVFWNEDGEGVLIDDDGRLRPAESKPGFAGYEDRRRLGMLPATPGTVAVIKDDSGCRLPVVGWMFDSDGWGTALIMTGEGVTAESNDVSAFDWPGSESSAG